MDREMLDGQQPEGNALFRQCIRTLTVVPQGNQCQEESGQLMLILFCVR